MALHELSRKAADADGWFTTAQARTHGVTSAQLATLRAWGLLETPHRGTHRFTAAPDSRRADLAKALLVAGDAAAASYESAAELLGLERIPPPDRPHVTVPLKGIPRLDDVVVHRTSRLSAADVTTRDGLRCTSGARTIIDLAARLEPSELIALVDDVICARHTSRSHLHRRAIALHNGRAGLGPVIKVTHPQAEGEFWSWLERQFGRLVSSHGLPRPQFNVSPPGLEGTIVDAFWPDPPLVVELDGLRFHRSPRQQAFDARRANRIALSGLPLLRYTWLDIVKEPERVAQELRSALGV